MQRQYSYKLGLLSFIFLSLALGQGIDEPQVGFIFFGDWGKGNEEQKTVARGIQSFCRVNRCNFATILGDNFYEDGVKSVQDPQWKTKFLVPYAKLNFPFWVVLGNHDYRGNIEAQIQYQNLSKKWKMPSRYYQFKYDNVEFFAIDTENFDSGQVKWLDHALQESKAEWKIVFGHHPIFSYGQHGPTPKLVSTLFPIIMKNKVDYYLSGHEHDKQVIEVEGGAGTELVVSGAAAETRPTRKGNGSLFANSSLGFAHLHIRGKRAYLQILDKNGNPEFQKHLVHPDMTLLSDFKTKSDPE